MPPVRGVAARDHMTPEVSNPSYLESDSVERWSMNSFVCTTAGQSHRYIDLMQAALNVLNLEQRAFSSLRLKVRQYLNGKAIGSSIFAMSS